MFARTSLRHAVRYPALMPILVALSGCGGLAQPTDTMPPDPPPSYASLASKYLQAVLKDRTPYDTFEIAAPRWVRSLKGLTWLTCVHFHDHGHLRTYAVFIQDNAVVDGRYAVESDNCETQNYTPFDLMTGALGQPTPPIQPPIY